MQPLGGRETYFNVRALHLGHLAKAFALREAPRSLGAKSSAIAAASTPSAKIASMESKKRTHAATSDSDSSSDEDDDETGDQITNRAPPRNPNAPLPPQYKRRRLRTQQRSPAALTADIVANADGSNRSKKLAQKQPKPRQQRVLRVRRQNRPMRSRECTPRSGRWVKCRKRMVCWVRMERMSSRLRDGEDGGKWWWSFGLLSPNDIAFFRLQPCLLIGPGVRVVAALGLI